MPTNMKLSSNPELWLTIIIFCSYAIGTLTVQHYLPSQVDFIPNVTVIGFLAIGMAALLSFIKIAKIGLDSIFWLLLFILVLIQPFFVTYDYLDNVIFPLASLGACFVLSVIINNVSDKEAMAQYAAYGFIGVGALSLIIQMLQYIGLSYLPFVMPIRPDDIRFYGNVAQPNQLAFIYALALGACHFIYSVENFKHRFLCVLLLVMFSAGIALSSSRGGLILALASLLFYAINAKNWISYAKKTCIALIAMTLGYVLGLYFLDIYAQPTAANAVSRMTEGSLYLRAELIQQAWVQFQHHPVIGVGLGNLLADSIHHVDELDWFVFSIHSHNLLAQVAAELGVLGLSLLLIPLYIILKSVWQSQDSYTSLVFISLLIVGLYSFSEYPLWFTRFLIIAVFLLALINTKTFELNLRLNAFFGIFCALLAAGCIYYYYQYQSYSRTNNYLINYDYSILDELTNEERREFADIQVSMVDNLTPVFGFSDYKELYIYYLLPEDNNQLDDRIELGRRVLTKFLTSTILLKQALYLGLNNQSAESLQLFRSACVLNHHERCVETTEYLNKLADQHYQFESIRKDYNEWKESEQL